ncbi:MAG: SDR family NAD(P)-dependent oxidoreductase, partial [Desulfotignum sp.]
IKEAFGVEALSFAADITDQEQTAAMADFAMKAFGQIDILINSAGIKIGTAISQKSKKPCWHAG